MASFLSGFKSKRWQSLLSFAAFAIISFMILAHFRDDTAVLHQHTPPPGPVPERPTPGTEDVPMLEPGHPIDALIGQATITFRELVAKEKHTLHEAAAEYRRRRNRHPPPGFDDWYKYATDNNAVMIEDLFDQIYHDIGPHWGLDPKTIRQSVAGQEYIISVRNGRLDKRQDKRYRINFWHEMFQKIAQYLPDMDVAFNVMDEPRLVIPWATMEPTMRIAQTRGKISLDQELASVDETLASGDSPIDTFKNEYSRLPPLVPDNSFNYSWITSGDYWNLYREICFPMMPVHYLESVKDFGPPSNFISEWPFGSLGGYVQNFSFSKDPCMSPEIRGLHGQFVEATSMSASQNLFPIFGGSKIHGGSDILLPAPRYWTDESKFTGKNFWSYFGTTDDWDKKRNDLFWRGVASGGRNRPKTWTHFHRHRFVSMLNGTQVDAVMRNLSLVQNIPIPPEKGQLDIAAIVDDEFPGWIDRMTDAKFTDLKCFPATDSPRCDYTGHFYDVVPEVDMYKMFDYKLLPDIDGNSFSGRYRAFLLSSSLPIKATIYDEWHDSRLVAWKHFVPMDNTFTDIYGIMDYFMGYVDAEGVAKKRGHNRWARQLAHDGQEWARKVLRKEDMLIYIYRLMLEYARVSDDNRETMGWVEDLK